MRLLSETKICHYPNSSERNKIRPFTAKNIGIFYLVFVIDILITIKANPKSWNNLSKALKLITIRVNMLFAFSSIILLMSNIEFVAPWNSWSWLIPYLGTFFSGS